MAQAIKGFQGLAALKKGATWGTSVLCGALNGFEHTGGNGGITSMVEAIENMGISGLGYQRAADAGVQKSSGSYGAEAAFEQILLPLALSLGTAGAPTQVGADNAYVHALRLKDDPYGLFGTLCFPASTTEVIEYASAKYDGFDISCSATGAMTITFKVICDSIAYNSGSGTNKNSTVASITIPANRARALGTGMVMWMNAQAGDALDAGDKISITNFSVSFARGLVAKHSTLGVTKIDEPEPGGFIMTTGSFTMPRYDSESVAVRAFAIAKSQHKASVTWTGSLIHGTSYYTLALYLNSMQIEGEPRITGPGADEVTYNFKAHGVSAAPTGFPVGVVQPIAINLTTGLSTDSLA